MKRTAKTSEGVGKSEDFPASMKEVYADLKSVFLKHDTQLSMLGEGVSLSEPTSFISLPIDLLNYAVGGDGIAYGKVTEISGPEQTGKSALALAILAENQRLGGVSAYFDTEFATSRKTAKELANVKEDELFIAHTKNFESCVATIGIFIDKIRKSFPDKPIAIAVDSVAGLSSKLEQEASFEQTIQLGTTPRLIRRFFRMCAEKFADSNTAFVITNHEIANIGAMPWEKKYMTLGGGGIKYWTSTRIRLQNAGYIKEDGIVKKAKVRATILKSRSSAPERQIEFILNLTPPNKGFDNCETTFTYLHEQKYFGGAYGGWYAIRDTKYREDEIIKHLRENTEVGQLLREEAKTLFETGWAYESIDPLAIAEGMIDVEYSG